MTVVLMVYAIALLVVAVIALWLWRHPPPEGCENCGAIGELLDHRCQHCRDWTEL